MNAVEIAEEVGVVERTVRRAISDGRLPATKRGRAYEIELADALSLWPPRQGAGNMARLEWLRREIPRAREKVIDLEAEALKILDDLHAELDVD